MPVVDQVPSRQLRDLQLADVEILREFGRVCEAHDLRYYLAYGTLLGAVLHRGFIPWDDDIDVTMPRPDYERFARICASEPRPGFTWQSYRTDRHYPFLFGKLLKDGTVLRQAPWAHLPLQHSVYIDVFPLDGGADGPWAKWAQRVVVRIAGARLRARCKRRRLKRVLVQLTRVIPRSAVIAVFEAMTGRVPTDGSTRWICAGNWYGYRRQRFPSGWFGPGATQVFEGLSLVGPVEWDAYLAQVYGDYMTPPPVADRRSHHQVTEVRLEVPPVKRAAP